MNEVVYCQGMCAGMPVETIGNNASFGWRGYHGIVASIDGDAITVDFNTVGRHTLPAAGLRPQVRTGCPCARCSWEREHHQ